jgi:hypothetical protein
VCVAVKYQLKYVQEGGSRDYDMCSFQLPDVMARPFNDLEAYGWAVVQLIPFIAANIKRATGYGYFNSLIEPGSIGAEIGVDMGDGAARILTRNPGKVYLIDPWRATISHDPWTDTAQKTMDDRYDEVCSRFEGDSRVEVRRMTSDQWFETSLSDSLDWIYLDGNHTCDQVMRDLENAHRVVKDSGYIVGDDLFTTGWMDDIKKALDWFISQGRWGIEVIWRESDPFVLKVRK